jgi:hypothetical protein
VNGLGSVSSIGFAAGRTGRDSSSSRAVTAIDHPNSGIRSGFILFDFILIVAVIHFIAPRIEYTADKCKEKKARYTDAPACAFSLARGG